MTLCFEAAKEGQLRDIGHSKERRVDAQIVLRLLVDRRDFPLVIGCFEDSSANTITIIPTVEQF